MKTGLHGVLHGLTDRLVAAGGPAVEVATLLHRDAALGLGAPGRVSPNGHCRLVPAVDGWLAVNLARPDDRDTVPAWLGTAPDDDVWSMVERALPAWTVVDALERATLLHLPMARVGETPPVWPALRLPWPGSGQLCRVVDLSGLWAGPLAGGLLAAAGATVVKVESPTRPDPTPTRTPALDQWLNGAKKRRIMALTDPALQDLIADADILITSARPRALSHARLTPAHLFERNPHLLWIAITAHGWTGNGSGRVGFGDDCAAAGGLLSWDRQMPRFCGDALADPCTGLIAAVAALEAVRMRRAGLLDVSLAGSAAWVAARMAGNG
jgi:hypothetical protein